MPSVEDIIIRRATAEDYEAIVGICDVYGGIDYPQDLFPQVVSDADVYPIVAELEGQVVGFMMDHVLDDGISVIRRAVRTSRDNRGMGITPKMAETLTRWTEERFPQLHYRYERIPIWENEPKGEASHLKGFVNILGKSILMLNYAVPQISGLSAKDGLPDVLALEYNDVKALFTLDDLLEQLFPLKRVFAFFIGYTCLESSIKHVLNDNKKVFVTTKTPSHMSGNTRISVLKDIDMVTFSYWYMAEAGLVYAIDLYIKDDLMEASLQAHFLKHIGVLRELNRCERGVLIVSLCGNMKEETVRSQLRNFGIMNPFPNALRGNTLYEKHLKEQN